MTYKFIVSVYVAALRYLSSCARPLFWDLQYRSIQIIQDSLWSSFSLKLESILTLQPNLQRLLWKEDFIVILQANTLGKYHKRNSYFNSQIFFIFIDPFFFSGFLSMAVGSRSRNIKSILLITKQKRIQFLIYQYFCYIYIWNKKSGKNIYTCRTLIGIDLLDRDEYKKINIKINQDIKNVDEVKFSWAFII